MAKKGKSIKIRLKCTVCNNINYTTVRRSNQQGKLEMTKFCKKCKKHTKHIETKIK